MRSRFSKLAVVAVLASSLPAIAVARDCDLDRDHHRPQHAYAPSYGAYPAPLSPRHGPDRWRDAGWRERELALLRAEFRELDHRRAQFYARHRGRGQVRKFERWYAARRVELERRWNELHYVAWR